MDKFAFYDFDDTLLKKDSTGHLLLYFLKRHPLYFYEVIVLLFYCLLYALKIVNFITLKEKLIFPLKHMDESELQTFYQEDLIPRYYPNVLSTMQQYHLEGYHVWLISASPEAYLKYTDLPCEVVMGTKTKAGTNHITSKNCKGEEKVARIKEVLLEKGLTIDFDDSVGYSDSLSDRPMLELVAHRYQVSKKDGSIHPFNF